MKCKQFVLEYFKSSALRHSFLIYVQCEAYMLRIILPHLTYSWRFTKRDSWTYHPIVIILTNRSRNSWIIFHRQNSLDKTPEAYWSCFWVTSIATAVDVHKRLCLFRFGSIYYITKWHSRAGNNFHKNVRLITSHFLSISSPRHEWRNRLQ